MQIVSQVDAWSEANEAYSFAGIADEITRTNSKKQNLSKQPAVGRGDGLSTAKQPRIPDRELLKSSVTKTKLFRRDYRLSRNESNAKNVTLVSNSRRMAPWAERIASRTK